MQCRGGLTEPLEGGRECIVFELAGQGCQPGAELMKTGDWLPEGFGLLSPSLRREGTIIADIVR